MRSNKRGFLSAASLLLVMVPLVASARTGRKFVSLEAYVGCARVVYVGKITEIEKVEYSKPLTGTQELGKPHRLNFKIGETIRGKEVEEGAGSRPE